MSIALTVQKYLDQQQVPFEVVTHSHTGSSLRTADQAHIPAERLAKAVLLEDDVEQSRYLMAVVPAANRVQLGELSRQAGRRVHLASEEEVAWLFADCEAGAIPPVGPAYGLETIWEDSLVEQPDLYFEAGDHEHLVHLKSQDFMRLLPDCRHGAISRPREQ